MDCPHCKAKVKLMLLTKCEPDVDEVVPDWVTEPDDEWLLERAKRSEELDALYEEWERR